MNVSKRIRKITTSKKRSYPKVLILGYTFKENAWMTVKLLLWVGLSAGIPIILKRTQVSKGKAIALLSAFLFLAVYMVYTKPF